MAKISVRELLTLRIDALEQRLQSERSMLLAAAASRQMEMERRLTALNELRAEVMTDRAMFVTRPIFDAALGRIDLCVVRESYEQQHKALADKVDVNKDLLAGLAQQVSNMRARSAAYFAAMGIGLTVVAAVMAVLQVVLRG